MPARLAVLISGNGSNLQAILDAIRLRMLDAETVVVVSNRKNAFGLERARAGAPRATIRSSPIAMPDAAVRSTTPTWLPWSRSMRRIGWCWQGGCTSSAMRSCSGFPIAVNLHPALPGQFPGARHPRRI